MSIVAIIFGALFALACGVFWALATRSEGRVSLYYWIGAGISLLQALALGIAAFYSEVGTPGYIITVTVVGLVLVAAIVWLSSRRNRQS